MSNRLTGKVAAVTGAGGPVGVGREVALAFAAEGASVVVNDVFRDPDGTYGADRVVEEIRKAKGTAVANYDSVATMSGGENITKTAIGNFGRIDILVNCAGNFKSIGSLAEWTEDDYDAIMDVHMKGHFSCIKAAAAEMIKQKSGRIINFSSGAAFGTGAGARPMAPPPPGAPPPRLPFGPGSMIVYGAAKAGILGLTWSLSSQLSPHGITVNAILPSAVTNLFPGQRSRIGGGPTGGPEDVAPMVVYLATDEAQNITGRFFYASSGDIIIFDRPMQIPGPAMFIRKPCKWTIDELSEVIPPLLGLG
jgi:NAD(P)-dependent dehydrogenase (short-subunit alcohol dehydrogenase family)